MSSLATPVLLEHTPAQLVNTKLLPKNTEFDINTSIAENNIKDMDIDPPPV